MNKIERRHKLILSLIKEKKLHMQQELQELLELNGITVAQSTLSRDIKLLNLVKVNEDASSYYMVNPIVPTRWEKRLQGWPAPSAQFLMPWKFPRLSRRFAETMSVSLFARIISQLKLVMTTSPNLPHHSFHQRNKKKIS